MKIAFKGVILLAAFCSGFASSADSAASDGKSAAAHSADALAVAAANGQLRGAPRS